MGTVTRGAIAAVTVGTAVILSAQASSGAVRLCGALVVSELFTAPEELDAKKKALDDWKAKVLPLGENYANWAIAADKLLACVPSMGGGYECVARGHPCTIEQAPDRKHLRDERIEM